MLNCRFTLEELFVGIIRGMAYPDSGIRKIVSQASYENIRRYLMDLDIVYSRTLGQDNNRTLHTVWFDDDGTLYQVEPGQTIITD